MDSRASDKQLSSTTTQALVSFTTRLSAQALSSFGTVLSSGISSAYQYLTRPAPPLLLKGPKARIKTTYEANVTASVSLPEYPKKKVKACKEQATVYPEPASTASYLFSSITSLFSRTHAPSSADNGKSPDNVVIKPRKPSSNDVDIKMIELVKAFNALADPTGQDKAEAEKLLLDQIDLVEQEIIEHAQRRVDLYFYMLIAVYKKEALIEKKSTHKQHGSGTNERGTNGCHDSLFPHVKLRYPKTTSAKVWSLFVDPPDIRHTHFEDANNMTMELPRAVNDFDTYMELSNPGRQSAPSKYVKACLDDLNLASQGKITPIDGMNRFLKNIKVFFNDFNDKHLEGKTFDFPSVMKKIWELQYVGTLRAQAFESDTIDMAYVCSLLRIPPSQTLKYIQDPSAILKQCAHIQAEIYNTPSTIEPGKRLRKR